MTDVILCIDIGTSSLKAAFMKDKPCPTHVARIPFSSGTSIEWIPALKAALSELYEKNPDCAIEAICISGNGPTIVSQNGTTLLHNDNGRSPEMKENLSSQGRYVRTSADAPFLPEQERFAVLPALTQTKSIFIPRLAMFKEMYPSEWENSKYIFSGPEYFIYRLTGEALTILPEERYKTAYWSNEELIKCGFSEEDCKKLPPFKKMGTFAGKVNEKAAIETGLLEGTFVFAGGPDFCVALIGSGTVMPGTLCDRAGSSEGINLCTSSPVFQEGIRTLPSPVPGLWNASILLGDTGKIRMENPGEETDKKLLKQFTDALNRLRTAAENHGEYFPSEMTVTGGQCMDVNWLKAKATASGLYLTTRYCSDSELIGDLILTRVALGDWDDIDEGVFMTSH